MGDYTLDRGVENELWSIWEYIARDNSDAANRVVEAAYKTFACLAATPGLGTPCRFRNPRLKGIRFFPVSGFENYLIFYRAVSSGVQVLHVYHGARDIEALFE